MKVAGLALLLVGGVLLSAGRDDVAEGVCAWREDRFPEALAAFKRAEERAGDGAPPELLWNEAMAALAAGRLVEAEIAAEKAAARGGDGFMALRDFLLGNVAYERCRLAAAAAATPGAGPDLLETAIDRGEAAIGFWRRALARRRDWPAARRNVERAERELEELERKKEQAAKGEVKKERAPEAVLLPVSPEGEEPPEDPGRATTEEAVSPTQETEELSPEQVRRLLGRLEEKEREKRTLRQRERHAAGSAVERDW